MVENSEKARLSRKAVLRYLERSPLEPMTTAQQLADEFEVTYQSATKMLSRMEESGLVSSSWDCNKNEKGNWVNVKIFHLVKHEPIKIKPEELLDKVIKFMQDTAHENLWNFSKALGGNQDGGGHKSAYEGCIQVLLQMGIFEEEKVMEMLYDEDRY